MGENIDQKCGYRESIRSTHSSVIKKVAKNDNYNIRLYNFKHKSWKNPNRKLLFYEVFFRDKIKISCTNKDEKIATDKRGVSVVAKFKIVKNKDNTYKTYTFLKIESSPARSLQHALDATNAYVLNPLKKTMKKFLNIKRNKNAEFSIKDLPKRKERDYSEIPDSINDTHISEFMNTLNKEYDEFGKEYDKFKKKHDKLEKKNHIQELEKQEKLLDCMKENKKKKTSIKDSCLHFDKIIRTGNEFFIPQVMTDELISNFLQNSNHGNVHK